MAAAGGDVYFKIALALLMAWLLEVVGVYQAHTLSRVCLLVGMMFWFDVWPSWGLVLAPLFIR